MKWKLPWARIGPGALNFNQYKAQLHKNDTNNGTRARRVRCAPRDFGRRDYAW